MNSILVANLVIKVQISIIIPIKISNKMNGIKKNAGFFFCFKEITYLCSPKMNHYTLLLPNKQ